ncbi:MAG: restriction endonuclease [Alphaproteobacteria bacterium]|nr:restriction endonuclease [Alphaproteobacteria bacterium]
MVKIEVASETNASTKDKGDLLENLVADILKCLNYKTCSQVALTGMEIDVLAEHNQTREEVFVECKANNSESISADVIKKLAGEVALRNASSGWLFYTGELSKGAKGIIDENKKRNAKIQIYGPENIIQLLINNKRICPHEGAQKPENKQFSENVCLLMTPRGMFWIFPILSEGLEAEVIVYDAKTNTPVSDQSLLKALSDLDTSFKTLEWMPSKNITDKIKEDIINQRDNIVTISCGDEWADYRPSRPQDYVGREEILSGMIKFLESVRKRETSTRIIGLSAPSGWGKSSTIVKLISTSKNTRNKNNIYVYGVDTRAAVSNKYVELVLLKCLTKAIEDGFIPQKFKNSITLGGVNNLLDSSSLIELFEYLRNKQKVILIYFDQFEELFLNNELSGLFDKFKQFINSVCEHEENLVVGFSWKTNINIPSDYSAYNIWHIFDDRRKNFELGPFTSKDISSTITKLEKESGKKLDAKLKRNLTDHCQGYPWLLKKLCIYVYKSLQNETETDIFFQKLNVEGLFKQDLENLTSDEKACIETIAKKSPVKEIEISQLFSADVINTLFNKRLLIKSGLNVSLYWDIFKDYVLTSKTPIVLEKYICSVRPQRYYEIIESLLEGKNSSEIAKELNLSSGTLDNVFRDAVMIGNIKKDGNKIELLQKDEDSIIAVIRRFFQEHELYDILKKNFEGEIITQADFTNIIKNTHPNFAEKTFVAYSQTMLEWLRVCGLIVIEKDKITLCNSPENTKKYLKEKISNGGGMNSFRGGAPYQKVDSFLQSLFYHKKIPLSITHEKGMRNVISLLKQFDLVSYDGVFLYPKHSTYEEAISTLKRLVNSTKEMQLISQIMLKHPDTPGPILGKKINEQFAYGWKKASEVRIGNGLKLWFFNINQNNDKSLSLF